MAFFNRMPDDEWEEVAEGVPSKEEPFIKKYLSGREALIQQEKKQRSGEILQLDTTISQKSNDSTDHGFREALSPLAKEACKIVSAIRDEERRTVWTTEFEEALAAKTNMTVYPGMSFSLAKERMESTKLWQIVRKMPKGALLHAHCDAMVDFDSLFEILLSTPGIHVHCSEKFDTPEQRMKGFAQFGFRTKKKETPHGETLWSKDYVVSTPVLLTEAADAFPDGGRKGFVEWLKERCTITPSESVEQHQGVDAVWRKFSAIFRMLDTMINYEPVFRAFLRRLMQQLYADGIKWVEIRRTYTSRFYLEGSEKPTDNFDEMFQMLDEEVKKFKASEEGKGFWGIRMIWTSLRFLDTRMIIEDMDNCIAMKLAYPHLISGYDLVGQEDGGRPHKDLLPELFWFRKQCAQEGIDIPFFFHAGECLGDGDSTDQNLYDAILLGTRRIGHGFSLYKHPLLIDMVKDKKILVESCPISNEVLRLCGSILSHPLPALLARGVACSLCNDDPAILGQDAAGMTHDFWQALQGWDNLGLAGLGSLAENSIRWSCFEDQSTADWTKDIKEASLGGGLKAERLKEWAVEWEQFCLWIVTEFGEDRESIRKIREEGPLDTQD